MCSEVCVGGGLVCKKECLRGLGSIRGPGQPSHDARAAARAGVQDRARSSCTIPKHTRAQIAAPDISRSGSAQTRSSILEARFPQATSDADGVLDIVSRRPLSRHAPADCAHQGWDTRSVTRPSIAPHHRRTRIPSASVTDPGPTPAIGRLERRVIPPLRSQIRSCVILSLRQSSSSVDVDSRYKVPGGICNIRS